jgi:hypothetical protein
MRSFFRSVLLHASQGCRLQATSYRLLSLCFLFAIVFFSGCGIEQTTITSNAFHNLTAHYNGYYYAREKAIEVEKMILKTLDDDPTQVLRHGGNYQDGLHLHSAAPQQQMGGQ